MSDSWQQRLVQSHTIHVPYDSCATSSPLLSGYIENDLASYLYTKQQWQQKHQQKQQQKLQQRQQQQLRRQQQKQH